MKDATQGALDDIDPPVMRALQTKREPGGHAGRIVMLIREFLTRREPQREPCGIMGVVESGAVFALSLPVYKGVALNNEDGVLQ